MSEALLEAVRGLRVADPDLGVKPLVAKLQEQQPDLAAGTREVREALKALKAESEAAKAAAAQPAADAAAPPAADEGGTPSNAALSLACIGCSRLPSDMGDDREKHPICKKCHDRKLPTTYWCCVNCPANPGAGKLHAAYHKELKAKWKIAEDGGVGLRGARETAEAQARQAARSGDEYHVLLTEGLQYTSKADWRRAAKCFRKAITLRPDKPAAYFNLGMVLNRSDHIVEAAQRYLEAKERYTVGSDKWAEATAESYSMLGRNAGSEIAKPEWWNDEGLKALSASVVRAAPNHGLAHQMRAHVLSGTSSTWEVGPRSPAELLEAATHSDRAAAMHPAPAMKASLAGNAAWCRSQAERLNLPNQVRLAAHRDELQQVVNWLQKGGHVDALDEHGMGLLHAAAHGGRLRVAKELLKRGAIVDMWQNYDGGAAITPLMVAALKGQHGVVRLLLEHKAIVDLQTADEDTALLYAAGEGHQESVQELLWAGASTELRNQEGSTALEMAEYEGHTATAELLWEHAAKLPAAVAAPTPNLLGRRVRIDGLQARPELNGRNGVARRFDAAKGRYEVGVEGEAEPLLLRPANLR